MKKKVLIIDKDKGYYESLIQLIEGNDCHIDVVDTVMNGMEKLALCTYHLVISELKLEILDGLEILKYVRKVQPQAKRIILTKYPSMEAEFAAIELEIDQYIDKAKNTAVLTKYIEMHLNSIVEEVDTAIIEDVNENIKFIPKEKIVYKNDIQVNLTPKEYEICRYLLENIGVAISREEIHKLFWDNNHESPDIHIIDANIKNIRRKLQVNAIVSVRGFGYKWKK